MIVKACVLPLILHDFDDSNAHGSFKKFFLVLKVFHYFMRDGCQTCWSLVARAGIKKWTCLIKNGTYERLYFKFL